MDIFRTKIVPADWVELARAIAASFGPGGEGMWITGCSDDGTAPATHYISSGFTPPEYTYLLPLQVWQLDENGDWILTATEPGDPAAVYAWCAEEQYAPNPEDPDNPIPLGPRVPCSMDDVEALFELSDITEQEPFVAMDRMGIQLVQTPMDM